MKKIFIKRIWSGVLAFSMLCGLCVNVSAAQVETRTDYWIQTFSGLTGSAIPDDMLYSAVIGEETVTYDAQNSDMSAIQDLGIYAGGAGGQYGKAGDDTAFYAEQKPDVEQAYANAFIIKTQTDTENAMKTKSGVKCPIGSGKFAHVSFEMALTDYHYSRTVNITAKSTTKKAPSDPANGPVLAVKENGLVSVFGSGTQYVMPMAQWVKYDLVFGDSENTTDGSYVDVYANGVKIIEGKRFDASGSKGMQQLGGIEAVAFKMIMNGNPENVLSRTGIDNFYVEKLSEYPQIQTAELSHTDAEINGKIDNTIRCISVPSSVTAEELKEGFHNDGVEIVDESGTVQAGPLGNGYVKVPIRDGYIYYKLDTYQQNFFIKEKFTGKAIAGAKELQDSTSLRYTGNGDVLSDTAIGARNGADTSLVLNGQGGISWTPDEAVQGERITMEASVLVKEGAQADVYLTIDGVRKSAAQFKADRRIYTAQADSGRGWSANYWYKIVASIDTVNHVWSVYINGETIVEDNMIDEETLQITAVNGIGIDTVAGAAADDIVVHTGKYIAGTDDVEITSKTSEYIVKEDEKTIYIPAALDKTLLQEGLNLSENCSFDAVYQDASFQDVIQTNEVSDGNILVLRTAVDSVYESYAVKVLTQPLEIIAGNHARITFDNEKNTIFAPAYMTAEAFCKVFTLYPGHSGRITNGSGEPVSAGEKYSRGSMDGYHYIISYTNSAGVYERKYTILTQYVSESFDDILNGNISAGSVYNGFLYNKQGVSGGTVTASGVKDPDDENENVLQFYSKPGSTSGTSQITFRLEDVERVKTKSPYVLTWDMKVSNTNSANSLILKYVNKDGVENNYYTLFEFASGGGINFSGSGIGTYEAGEWYRVVMVLDPGGTGNSRIYINGKKVFDKAVGRFQKTIDSVQDFIFTHGITGAERITYIDNMSFYPIASVSAFDASGMDSSIHSEWDIISGSNITGYGPCTVEDFLKLFTFPQGAKIGLYQEDGVSPVNGGMAEKGMKMTVTSADGVYTAVYTLGEAIRISAPVILIGGRNMKYLIAGDATAQTTIYSASPMEAQLTLSYKKGDFENVVSAQRTKEERGETKLLTPAAAAVENVEGEKLELKLTDTSTGRELAQPVVLEWTGQLDLTSEITKAKNGATSIVTVTLDDGLTTALNKCNKWFEAYGLKGSSVIWSDRAASNKQTYANIYEKGYIDVTSHSKTHKDLTNYGGLTDALRMSEIQGSREELRSMFSNQEVITFAPSNNRLDTVSQQIVGDYFWAVRQGKRGYNSLDPAEGSAMGAWNNLLIQGSYNPQNLDGKACSLNDCLDEAAENPVWLIEMYHSIETKEGVGTLPVTDSVAQPHFKKMGELQEQGKIWVATFNEATKYIRERQHTLLTDVATETERTVKLEMDGELPPSVFNAPLTVKSQVPDTWALEGKYVKVTQGGTVQAPNIQNIDGGLYVLYEAYPNGTPVKLESVDEVPLVTVKEIKVSAEGELSQVAGKMTPVTFTASTEPVDNTNTSGIEWYVNGQKQETVQPGTLTFQFETQKIGRYDICAKDSISGLSSKIVSVVLSEAGLKFEDDFEGYDADVLPSSKWYANTDIYLDQYPQDSGDVAAKVAYNSNAVWPGMHKTVSVTAGEPIVFSGDVAMNGSKQAFFLEMRNAVNVTESNRMTGLQIKNGEITAIDGTVIANIAEGEWVHYALTVKPAPKGEESTVRVVLNSPYLTDANGGNTEGPVIYEVKANLDVLGITENESLNMVHNNNFSKADNTCQTYLNNVRIYAPQRLDMMSGNTILYYDKPLSLTMNNEVYGLKPDMITLADTGGNTVPCSVIQDTLGLRKLTIEPQRPLKKGEVYKVILNGGESAVNATGALVGTVEETIEISKLDSIKRIDIKAEGAVAQTEDSLSRVYFKANTNPAENVDTTAVEWYVNDDKQDAKGLEFDFKPTARGVYAVTARVGGVVSDAVAINVTAGLAKALEITVNGVLNQTSNEISKVIFTAEGVPQGNVVEAQKVKWFLNGVLAAQGTDVFEYTPSGIGACEIYAQLEDQEDTRSNKMTVRVEDVAFLDQTFILRDAFEKHGKEGTVIETANAAPWSSALKDNDKWTEIAKDPAGSGNLCAKFSYSGNKDAYPRLQASAGALAAGVPLVISSKVYLTPSSSFLIELVGKNRKEVLKFDKGGSVVIINGETIEKTAFQPKEWLWFSAYIVPGEDLAASTVRLVLSGNVSGNKVIESKVNLSGVGFTNNVGVYFNTGLKSGKADAVYVDEAKIYVPQAAYLKLDSQPNTGDKEISISFNHDINPSTLTRENIQVNVKTGTENTAAVIKDIQFDVLNPAGVTILLEEEMTQDTEYTVSLTGNVEDNCGKGVYGSVIFKTEDEKDGLNVTSLYFTDGTQTISKIDWSGAVTANAMVDNKNAEETKAELIAVYYDADGIMQRLYQEQKFVPANAKDKVLSMDIDVEQNMAGGSIRLFVWDSMTGMRPVGGKEEIR